MSEFSQSYHLASDDAGDAEALLRRAGVAGWVFPPGNGWVTLLPDPDIFGEPLPALVAANTGTLVHYLNAEDHGWTFTIFQGAEVVCAYGCSWEDELAIEDARLDLTVIDHIIQANALEPMTSLPQVQALLHPEDLEQVAAYFKHTEGRNPGHGFAEAIGLEFFHWISSDSVARDGGKLEGVELIRIG